MIARDANGETLAVGEHVSSAFDAYLTRATNHVFMGRVCRVSETVEDVVEVEIGGGQRVVGSSNQWRKVHPCRTPTTRVQ